MSWEVKGQEDIIYISEIVNDPCMCDRSARCTFSLCCKKSSTIKPDKGGAHCKAVMLGYQVLVVGELVLSCDNVISH